MSNKSTDQFKATIKEYLDNRASNDSLFAQTYAKEGKNIDDCITFILNSVKKADIQGWTDEEIFGMAVHYYDEDDIDIGGSITMQVVVNHKVQLTDEELLEARESAKKKVEEEQIAKLKKRKKSSSTTEVKQQSLF